MKRILVSTVVMLLVGCASTGNVENIQSQIDDLKTPVNAMVLEAADAKTTALKAAVSASFANYYATTAENFAEQTQFKLDRLATKYKLIK